MNCPMTALALQYLTGYASATDAASRYHVEWPPHPARLFMAMVAAWHETRPLGADPQEADEAWRQEGAALRWLEELPPPALAVSDHDPRSVVEVFVPPNDMTGAKRTVVPAFRTNRQPRTFPRTRLHDDIVYFIWKDADPDPAIRVALERLSGKLIRVGHSSSLVRAWLPPAEEVPSPNWIAADPSVSFGIGARLSLRTCGPGTLEYLEAQYGAERNARFIELSDSIASFKGKARNEAKARFEEEFGLPWRPGLRPPEPIRPVISSTTTYCQPQPSGVNIYESWFDHNITIFSKFEGPNLGLESTWQILSALRGTILSVCDPVPEWASGHQASGAASESPHMALFPLGYVGSMHADGHLLGVALAFPRNISARERGRALGRLLYDADGTPKVIDLKLGKLGCWSIILEDRPSPPLALRPETWAGTSDTWASVTPVVLDRHPKTDPAKDRIGWKTEVAEIVAEACQRTGLPVPIEIDIDKTSWHRGAPRSKPGPDGFPLVPQKPGGPLRPQIHVWLRFDSVVQGPVLLGAGRYRGYGLCKPWWKGERQ